MSIFQFDCRKRKVHLYEEHPLDWNFENHNRIGSFCKKSNKPQKKSLINEELDICKGQDIVMDSNSNKLQIKKMALERYESEEPQLWKENNYIGRNDLGIQWKEGNDVTNNFENNMVDFTDEKSPQPFKRFSDNDNNIANETFLNNNEHWSYENPSEGTKKSNQSTIVSLASKCHEIEHDKESLCINYKKSEIQNMNSNKILESLSNPILYSKNMGCIELMEPSSGWVYHTSYKTISRIYTLEQLQKGLESSFLPKDLPIYRVIILPIYL